MKDESSEDDSDVGCPYCESGSRCDHLLLFFDATDGRADGGVVDPYDFDEIAAKVFVKVLKEGADPNWHDWRINELFEQIDDEWAATMLTATTPELPESLPIDFVFELLDVAGGAEHSGSLFDQSGGYFVEIAPGESLMTTVRGGIVDVPVVSKVQITRPFLIGQTEVTVGEWQQVMGSTPGDVDQENLPVTPVSWHDAVAFCETLSSLPEEKEQGRRYRLPTNAEWEYACRAGTTSPIWFGDDHELVEEYAWMRRNSAGRNHPVGLKPPNPWGLYDIRGNVHEWVSDWRADSWKPEPVDADEVVVDPQGPDHSPFGKRLVRGGSKLDNPDAFATELPPENRSHNVGFRVVAVVEEDPSGNQAAEPENQEVLPRNP